MTGFDWLVLGLVPVMVYLGYRLGFLVSTLSFGGFVVGILVGLAAAPGESAGSPRVARRWPSPWSWGGGRVPGCGSYAGGTLRNLD